MFLFNWFRQVDNSKSAPQCEQKIQSDMNNDDVKIIPRDEYNALINRLSNLEAMIIGIQCKQSSPIANTPPEHYQQLPSVPKEVLTPFQIELENKLKSIREKMGASHGFGIDDFALDNLDDLSKLEQSVLEQSTMRQ